MRKHQKSFLVLISALVFMESSCRTYSRQLLRGRIHDGKCGVVFAEGSMGRVEGCQIWGNAGSSVVVQDSSSEAVVVGCKCVGGRAGAFCWTRRLAYF